MSLTTTESPDADDMASRVAVIVVVVVIVVVYTMRPSCVCVYPREAVENEGESVMACFGASVYVVASRCSSKTRGNDGDENSVREPFVEERTASAEAYKNRTDVDGWSSRGR